MLMCNLIEYSDNYPDTSRSVWQFKRNEVTVNNADLSINSQSFKYKADLVRKAADINDGNSFVKSTNTDFPLKYLSNFWG